MKRTCSLFLSFAVLLCAVSVAGVVPAAAATVSGGTVTAVTSAADLPAADNLLSGKTPFWGNGNGTNSIVTITAGNYPYLEGSSTAVADGKVQGVDVIAAEDTCADSALRVAANNGSFNLSGYDRWRTQVWISFDMGEAKTVNTFLLAHSLLGNLADGTAAGKLADSVTVRVTDTVAELATADPVMTFTAADLGSMPNVMVMTLDEAVTGQYVGFYITVAGSNTDYFLTANEKKANYVYLSELGAYFAAPEETVTTVDGGKVTKATAGDLPTTGNLLSGQTPFWGNGGGTNSIVTITAGNYPYLEGSSAAVADGKVQGIDVIADEATCADSALRVAANNGSFNLSGYDHWRTQVWISFDMGAAKTVDTFLLAHSLLGDLAGGAAAGKLADSVTVRVTDTVAELATADPVMTFTAADLGSMPNVMVMTLDEAVTGQYVGFYITVTGSNADYFLTANEKKANYVYLSELGAYLENPPVLTSLGGQVRSVNAQGQAALRFGFELANNGVAYANPNPEAACDYTRDLSAATVKVDGESYPITDMGAIVSITADYGDTLDKADVQKGKIADVTAQKLYAVEDGKVTFTAVAVNIPADQLGTTIHAIPYVEYETAEGTAVLYGDLLQRSVNDVLDAPEM